MSQTYRGRIEGGLESVPGLYKSLIGRKKGPDSRKIGKKIEIVHKLTPGEPDWDIEDLFLHSFSNNLTW